MPPSPLPASVLLAIGLSTASADTGGSDTGEDTGGKDVDMQVCLCAVVDGGTAAVALAGAALLATRRRRRGDALPERGDARSAVLDRGVLPDDVAAALRAERDGS